MRKFAKEKCIARPHARKASKQEAELRHGFVQKPRKKKREAKKTYYVAIILPREEKDGLEIAFSPSFFCLLFAHYRVSDLISRLG